MKMKMKLKRIDLTRGEGHNHPDIKTDGTPYLTKYDGYFYAGTFDEEWFGLTFEGWHSPLQFDAPDTNYSEWTDLWEIVETKNKRKK